MPGMRRTDDLEFTSTPHAGAFILRALRPRRYHVEAVAERGPTAQWRMSAPWSVAATAARVPVFQGSRLPEITVPQIVGFRLALALLSHQTSGMNVWTTLQVRSRLRQTAPIRGQLPVELHASLGAVYDVPRGRERVLRIEVTQAGDAVWESETVFLDRAAAASRGDGPLALPAPNVRGEICATMQVPRTVRWRWARLSGDYNAIHLSEWYARRLGYRHAFGQPLFIAGAALRQSCGDRADRWRELSLWYRGPIFYGLPVDVVRGLEADAELLGLRAEGDPRMAVIVRATEG